MSPLWVPGMSPLGAPLVSKLGARAGCPPKVPKTCPEGLASSYLVSFTFNVECAGCPVGTYHVIVNRLGETCVWDAILECSGGFRVEILLDPANNRWLVTAICDDAEKLEGPTPVGNYTPLGANISDVTVS